MNILYDAGIANELFPLILFIGIGAMIDFGPLLSNPEDDCFGAAAQFGIFITFSLARLFGFFAGSRSHGYNRRCGRSDGNFVFQLFWRGYKRHLLRHYRGRLFVYGARPHRAACGHPLHHHEKRAAHQDGIQTSPRFQKPRASAFRFLSPLIAGLVAPKSVASSAF